MRSNVRLLIIWLHLSVSNVNCFQPGLEFFLPAPPPSRTQAAPSTNDDLAGFLPPPPPSADIPQATSASAPGKLPRLQNTLPNTSLGIVSICVRPLLWCAEAGASQCRKADAYTGLRNFTVAGLPCQAWSSQSPNPHTVRLDPSVGNACRNPDGDEAPWCYTLNPSKRWDYCFPTCKELREEESRERPKPRGLLEEKSWLAAGKTHGDMDISREALSELVDKDNAIFNKKQNDASLDIMHNAIRFKDYLWPDGRVPYLISSTFSEADRDVLQQAFQAFHSKTCIRFVPREDTDTRYVWVRRLLGCSSQVGREHGSRGMGPQTLSLDWGCVNIGTVIHELMHAIGFFHEQSRNDRDDYVRIAFENVDVGPPNNMSGNFEKLGLDRITHLDAPYDYASVMHYPADAFSKNNKNTIIKLKEGPEIGNRDGFSKWDIIKINRLYNCGTRATPDTGDVNSILHACLNFADSKRVCPVYAVLGRCETQATEMEFFCKSSCCINKAARDIQSPNPAPSQTIKCDTLADKNENCGHWAQTECSWLPWGSWGSCSASCGEGRRHRLRSFAAARNGGRPCDGLPAETDHCALKPCKPVCGFGDWSVWSPCSVSCGSGRRSRSRALVSAEPSHPAAQVRVNACPPTSEDEDEACTLNACPPDCGYGPWEDWGACSATCGSGRRRRMRLWGIMPHVTKTFSVVKGGGRVSLCPPHSDGADEDCTMPACPGALCMARTDRLVLGGRCLWVPLGKASYDDGRQRCRRAGGTLANFNSAKEIDSAITFVKDLPESFYWVGLKQRSQAAAAYPTTSSGWYWEDDISGEITESSSSNTKWGSFGATQQPNDGDGVEKGKEQWAMLAPSANGLGDYQADWVLSPLCAVIL